MATAKQIETRQRELDKKIADIYQSTELTTAEKSTQLDAIAPDYEALQKEFELSERVTEMRSKLKAPDSGAETEDGAPIRMGTGRMEARTLRQTKRALAYALANHPQMRSAVEELGGIAVEGKSQGFKGEAFEKKFSVELKDSTAAGNGMGEGFFGAGPGVAAGQNLFAPGAWGEGILPTFLPGIVQQPLYDLSIADILPAISVSTPIMSYLMQGATAWNAAETAEGAAYPFSSVQFTRVDEQVGKITNAAEVSDEGVRDAPQLFSFLQNELITGIERQEEVQLLAGNGYPGVNGLLNRASGFTQDTTAVTAGAAVNFPAVGTPAAGVTSQALTGLRYGRVIAGSYANSTGAYPTGVQIGLGLLSAITQVKYNSWIAPNAVLINPLDWELMRKATDNNGQFFGGSFFGTNYGYAQGGGTTLWDTRVVQTPSIPQGSIVLGGFYPETITAARKEAISVQMSNQNGTNFVDGMVTVRAEERLGLMVFKPAAFQLIQLATGTSTVAAPSGE